MDHVNALTLRQSLGRVLKTLQKNGKPILVEKDRKPAAVLISLEDYKKRFVDYEADEQRKAIIERIASADLCFEHGQSGVTILRSLRNGER